MHMYDAHVQRQLIGAHVQQGHDDQRQADRLAEEHDGRQVDGRDAAVAGKGQRRFWIEPKMWRMKSCRMRRVKTHSSMRSMTEVREVCVDGRVIQNVPHHTQQHHDQAEAAASPVRANAHENEFNSIEYE